MSPTAAIPDWSIEGTLPPIRPGSDATSRDRSPPLIPERGVVTPRRQARQGFSVPSGRCAMHPAGDPDAGATLLYFLASLAPWRDHCFSSLRLCAFVREFLYLLAPWCDLDRDRGGRAGQPGPHSGQHMGDTAAAVSPERFARRQRHLPGFHAPAWEQVPTLQRRVPERAAGAAGLHSHAGAWEREEHGLMDNLITGSVRVTPDEPQ